MLDSPVHTYPLRAEQVSSEEATHSVSSKYILLFLKTAQTVSVMTVMGTCCVNANASESKQCKFTRSSFDQCGVCNINVHSIWGVEHLFDMSVTRYIIKTDLKFSLGKLDANYAHSCGRILYTVGHMLQSVQCFNGCPLYNTSERNELHTSVLYANKTVSTLLCWLLVSTQH